MLRTKGRPRSVTRKPSDVGSISPSQSASGRARASSIRGSAVSPNSSRRSLVAEAVVVVNAVDPFAAQFAVVDAAHQGSVLARDGGLVAISVEGPGLNLSLIQLSAVQKLMERMLVVIALGSDGQDGRFKLGFAHWF